MDPQLQHWVAAQMPGNFDSGRVRLHALKAEASFRHFYRVLIASDPGAAESQAGGCVLMVSPPERENNAQFKALIPVFRQAGVRVPTLIASRDESGWFLLEDLGDRDLEQAYAGKDREPAIRAAFDALSRIRTVHDARIPPYTEDRFRDELGIFREWFLERLLQTRLPEPIEPAMHALTRQPAMQTQCCVHRDYHCRNLLFPASGELGVVDFQDALTGPYTYDLASLLHDCYYRFDFAEIDHWREQFRQTAARDLSALELRRDVEFCAVQRQLKAIGIFARLHFSRGISTHLKHIVPVLERLPVLCAHHAELQALGHWLDELLPAATRALESCR